MQNKAETIIRPFTVATGEEALETEGKERAEVQVGAWPTKVRSANRLCGPVGQNEKFGWCLSEPKYT